MTTKSARSPSRSVPAVETEPFGDLGGEPVHRVLDRHERLSGELGVAYPPKQLHGEVVEGHVAQVRAGIGEAHVDRRVDGERVEVLGPVVGDDRRPAHVALAVLDEHVEEGVERMHAAFVGDLPEALADQRSRRGIRRSWRRGSRGATTSGRASCGRTTRGTGGGTPGRRAARCARSGRAGEGRRYPRRTPRTQAGRYRRSTARTARAGAGTARTS